MRNDRLKKTVLSLSCSAVFLSFFFAMSAFAEMDVLPGAAPPATPPTAPQQTMPQTMDAPPMQPPASAPAPVVNPQPSGFYYYCESYKAYYPTVGSCPESWVAIPVAAPPPTNMGWGLRPVTLEPAPEERDVVGRPNVLSAEIFGRALNYSLDFDRQLSDYVSLGVGFSYWDDSLHWNTYQASVTAIPLYMNFYSSQRESRGFLSVGADLIRVSNPGDSGETFENSGVAGTVGGGFEFRDQHGFLARLAAFLIIGRSTLFNPALSIGVSF